MSRRTRLVTALGAGTCVLALLAGCNPATPTAGGSTTPTPVGSGDGGSSQPPASSAPAATFPSTAEAYSQAAITDWRNHDTTALGTLNAASDTVFQTLNAGNYNTQFTTLYMCDGAAGSTYCTWYNAVGDLLRLQLRNDLIGQAHAIVGGTLIPITFPTDDKAYAQETLDAWQGHNTAAVALLTGKPGDTAFNGVPASLRSANDLTFSRADGTAGHEYYVWRDGAGNELAFGFVDPGIVSPPANRHGLVEAVVYTPHS